MFNFGDSFGYSSFGDLARRTARRTAKKAKGRKAKGRKAKGRRPAARRADCKTITFKRKRKGGKLLPRSQWVTVQRCKSNKQCRRDGMFVRCPRKSARSRAA